MSNTFTQVNLTQVNLTQVNLTQVNLTQVNLAQVNLAQVSALYPHMGRMTRLHPVEEEDTGRGLGARWA